MEYAIATIDLKFLGRPHAIAAFAVPDESGYTLVECGPYSTHRNLIAGLKEVHIDPERVHSLLLTHIHFDHAGAAWWWARQGTQVYVHPRGYRHMVDPDRLYQSAKQIYGDRMEELWGESRGIEPDRIQSVEDRDELRIGDRSWVAHHTPGHAKHHIAWQLGADVFTGDVGGCGIDGGPVIPPCPPPDIDVPAWKESIARLRSLGAERFFLTHYGAVTDPARHLNELEDRLDRYVAWVEPHFRAGRSPEEVAPLLSDFVVNDLREHGVGEDRLRAYLAANPPDMSAAGILRYLGQRGAN
jgi:glyoxylase-like metal-dependent hydrolase (beta-lactamase superfamily II)